MHHFRLSLPIGIKRSVLVFFWLLLSGFSTLVPAEPLRVHHPDGLYLNAEYLPGDTARPAILVLHGFLQTHEFLTTQSMINSLSLLGYSVLGPNLSFGISNRRQSMQCEAPHNHRFEEDLREIDYWVSWLKRQGHTRVILVGHSWGSQHALGYAATYREAPVSAVIAVSLVRSEQSEALRQQQVAAAKAKLSRGDKSLHPYLLSFCKKYMSAPHSYLSYARWGDQHVLDILAKVHERQLPVFAVMGKKDNRLDDEWVNAVRQRTSGVTVIEGANHFFSSLHEFELNDRLEELLAQISGTRTGK